MRFNAVGRGDPALPPRSFWGTSVLLGPMSEKTFASRPSSYECSRQPQPAARLQFGRDAEDRRRQQVDLS